MKNNDIEFSLKINKEDPDTYIVGSVTAHDILGQLDPVAVTRQINMQAGYVPSKKLLNMVLKRCQLDLVAYCIGDEFEQPCGFLSAWYKEQGRMREARNRACEKFAEENKFQHSSDKAEVKVLRPVASW